MAALSASMHGPTRHLLRVILSRDWILKQVIAASSSREPELSKKRGEERCVAPTLKFTK
jgi:hypothetical protein